MTYRISLVNFDHFGRVKRLKAIGELTKTKENPFKEKMAFLN
jgi:hypothetical protein